MTGVLCPNVVGDLPINDKTVVDKQFIADVDRREHMDESSGYGSAVADCGRPIRSFVPGDDVSTHAT